MKKQSMFSLELRAWLRLLWQHRFSGGPQQLLRLLGFLVQGGVNSTLSLIQDRIPLPHACFGQDSDPIFIIGFWRSGTTYLHELLNLDPNFASPNSYQCMHPSHFLLTEQQALQMWQKRKNCLRPMDGMAISSTSPQEDEFALLARGGPSVYRSFLFSRDLDHALNDLVVSGASERKLSKILSLFLRQVSHSHGGRRLLIKSPPHMSRIGLIRQLYPNARFIHIIRNPYHVFPSARRMWIKMCRIYGLQPYNEKSLDRFILKTWPIMDASLAIVQPTIPKGHYTQLFYEAFIQNPIVELKRVYTDLDLGDFSNLEPNLRRELDRRSDYQTNPTPPSGQDKRLVTQFWMEIVNKYGYQHSL